jgi:hypothetical protein
MIIVGLAAARSSEESSQPSTRLSDYFLRSTQHIDAIDDSRRLRVGDPVFSRQDGTQAWYQVGHVETVDEAQQGGNVKIVWYGEPSPDEFQLVSFHSSGQLDEVIATMLPEDKRKQIGQRLSRVLESHAQELTEAFTPLVQSSMRQSIPVIESEVRLAVERHRTEVDHLADRWNDELVSKRLIPMARREILPIVRRHGEPTAEQIGRELWNRASIWRFGWRIVYDRSPLPERNLTQEEWDRFVEEEAVPVFEEHMDEVVIAIQRILSDVASNDYVRSELADVASQVAADPQARELVRTILREALIDNERLKQVWRDVWTSQQAQAALRLASDRLEPVVRGIGDDLFGSEEAGIDPNFARVLRNQILRKDRRWIVATPKRTSDSKPIHITTSAEFMPYPVVYMADRNVTGDSDG